MPVALETAFVGQTKSSSVVTVVELLGGEDKAAQLQTSCTVNAFALPGVRPCTVHAVVAREVITGQLAYVCSAAASTLKSSFQLVKEHGGLVFWFSQGVPGVHVTATFRSTSEVSRLAATTGAEAAVTL